MRQVQYARNHLYLFDDGTGLVDGISGTYNMPLGHCSHEERTVIQYAAASDVFNSYKEDDGTAAALGAYLNRVLEQDRHWHFMTTGSEAVERALMCAVPRGGRVAMFDGAFHGKSFMTHKAHYRTPYAEPIEIVHLDWNCPMSEVPPVQALIFEPVQGWTGRRHSFERMRDMQDWATATGTVLIADEILTGFGRAGPLLSSSCINPDILLLAKGMAGSIPMSAVGLLNDSMAPAVGWTATHASNSLANVTAMCFLPHVIRAATDPVRHMHDSAWREAFPGEEHRITGSLVYIKVPEHKASSTVVKALRERGFLVADHNPYLRLCPCYTMPSGDQAAFINAIQECIQ